MFLEVHPQRTMKKETIAKPEREKQHHQHYEEASSEEHERLHENLLKSIQRLKY